MQSQRINQAPGRRRLMLLLPHLKATHIKDNRGGNIRFVLLEGYDAENISSVVGPLYQIQGSTISSSVTVTIIQRLLIECDYLPQSSYSQPECQKAYYPYARYECYPRHYQEVHFFPTVS